MSNAETDDPDVRMSFENLGLYSGAMMSIQPLSEEAHERYGVKFIGFIEGCSILVTLPVHDGKGLWMQTGQTFVIRGFNGKYAYAFSAQVLRARALPFPYVHFSWPHNIECQLVRSSLRVAVSMPVNVIRSNGTPASASLLDLSISGAMVDSPGEIGVQGEHIKVELKMDVEGRAVSMNINAVIHNIHRNEEGTGFKTGLEFQDVSQNDRLVLHYYIDSVRQSGSI